MPFSQETPFLACRLDAMDSAQRERHLQVGERLRAAAQDVKELPDGYAFRYPYEPALFMEAAEFVSLESRCCSFYRFALEKEPGESSMWLHINGPEQTKSFVARILMPER